LSYKNRSNLIRAVLIIAVAISSVSLVHAAQFSVEAVKAAYLFRFAQYVEWPDPAPADAPFVIAVFGAEDVAAHLERLLPGMTVNGRPATVRRVTRAQELERVHILFIGADAFNRSRGLRAHAVEKPILIVTENQNGIDGGGVINFMEVNRNLRFEISLNAADRIGLKINSALLSVAARVERRPQGAVKCPDGLSHRQRSGACRMRMVALQVRRAA
jgi:hypothetical protein